MGSGLEVEVRGVVGLGFEVEQVWMTSCVWLSSDWRDSVACRKRVEVRVRARVGG